MARIEIYMKAGTVGLSTNGAIVRVADLATVRINVVTRLTGGSVVDLDANASYVYQFNVAGEGRFALAVRRDGSDTDVVTRAFDASDAKQRAHADRSFPFHVPR